MQESRGYFDSSLEKYKKHEEEDDHGFESEDREESIEAATEALEAASGNLPADLQEKFQSVVDTADTYYDLDPVLAGETLELATSILEQLSDISDEDEMAEKVSDLEEEISRLEKLSDRLAKKGAH